ncbi:hypothetical protein TNCV_2590411 [Trichonephila clavipes]|nr:hypothetical protein TNCV_2590411 [Trichonephila clavipes]
MSFFQFLRSFLQPPTTKIVESCYRISNVASEEVELRLSLSLQPRKKGQNPQPNLKENDIVVLKENNPSDTWPMA